MTFWKRALRMLALAATVQIFLVSEAYAYVDAGTGSFIIQMVVAAVVGISVTLRMYWQQTKAMLTRQPTLESEPTEKETGGSD